MRVEKTCLGSRQIFVGRLYIGFNLSVVRRVIIAWNGKSGWRELIRVDIPCKE